MMCDVMENMEDESVIAAVREKSATCAPASRLS
jgi:hypothetical protein